MMKSIVLLVALAIPAAAQDPMACAAVKDGQYAPISCGSLNGAPSLGSVAITYPHFTGGAPSNEVVMQPLEFGKTYESRAASLHILPESSEVKGFMVTIRPKVHADSAIIEVFYRTTTKMYGRDIKLLLHKTITTTLVEDAEMLCDEIPLDLDKVEKINVRLVSESNVVEFWSDQSAWVDHIEKRRESVVDFGKER